MPPESVAHRTETRSNSKSRTHAVDAVTEDAVSDDAVHAVVVRREVRKRRRTHSTRKRGRRRVSARRVFYGVGAVALGTAAGLGLVGLPAVVPGIGAAVLIVGVLYMSDRNQFNRSSQVPRAGEPPRQFTFEQQIVLIALFVLNVFLAIQALI